MSIYNMYYSNDNKENDINYLQRRPSFSYSSSENGEAFDLEETSAIIKQRNDDLNVRRLSTYERIQQHQQRQRRRLLISTGILHTGPFPRSKTPPAVLVMHKQKTHDQDGVLVENEDMKENYDDDEEERLIASERRCMRCSICFIVVLLSLFFLMGLFFGHFVWKKTTTAFPITNTPVVTQNDTNNDTKASKQLVVGAYYYPWYTQGFHHGQGYLRKDLKYQLPVLGEYDDTDPIIIQQHLKWSRQANIGLWVTSWWGEGSIEDVTTRTIILEHSELGSHKIGLFYETMGRIIEHNSTDNVLSDMTYMCDAYFGHSNYFRINERPVLFVYLTRYLHRNLGMLEEVVDLMRKGAKDSCGEDIYIVGDQVFGKAPSVKSSYVPFSILDAATNYDVYGNMKGGIGGYMDKEDVDYFYQIEQRQWLEASTANGCAFVPSISPGYNDRAVRSGNFPLSRMLNRNGQEGSLFELSLKHALTLLDDENPLLLVNSFNEWHEDTQIEPVTGKKRMDPFDLTSGITYYGYEELYLDILGNGTRDYFDLETA